MSAKVDYGLHWKSKDIIIHWPDDTGWWVTGTMGYIWIKGGDGWSDPYEELEGAALVAPLPILFWEKE